MEVKVNFRITKDNEIIAVFMGKQRNNTYLCYSIYDDMHFDSDKTYLKECKPARNYNIDELCNYLKNRGYSKIKVLNRIIY